MPRPCRYFSGSPPCGVRESRCRKLPVPLRYNSSAASRRAPRRLRLAAPHPDASPYAADDERYRPMFGKTATTPLFGVRVPILAHELAQPDKGTGIAMISSADL